MKILQLRFKNLNSLVGEWLIDFSHPEYISDGIFAIIGPTGAGKSTILDAICLALYGRTPRLKGINKTSNEIMSRQTGECFAEVLLETQAGSYRCHWSQHRARKKAKGKLADSKHEISDLLSGRVIESKKRQVAVVIEEKTGMDFDRFTRSILLAQGGFAAFLQATADERAPILEQITGSEIYSEISKAIHERQREENAKLELFHAEMAGLNLLSEEDETLVKQSLIEKRDTEKQLSQKNDELKQAVLWLNGIEGLRKELILIEQEFEAIVLEKERFIPDQNRLNRALTAMELESDYATLVLKRQQQKIDLQSLHESEAYLPQTEQSLSLKTGELEQAERDVKNLKTLQKTELELIKNVRAFDLRIVDKQSALAIAREACQIVETQIAEKKAENKILDSSREKLVKQAVKVDKYLLDHAGDVRLVTDLSGINEQIKSLQQSTDIVREANERVVELKNQAEQNSSKHSRQQSSCKALEDQHNESKSTVVQIKAERIELLAGRLFREYRTELESLFREMAYLKKITSLQEEREKLMDNKPCPLCGSLHHPFAEGNSPTIDETEKQINDLSILIKLIEQKEYDLKNYESKEKETGFLLAEAEKILLKTLHDKDESIAKCQSMDNNLLGIKGKYQADKAMLSESLLLFAVNDFKESELDAIAEGLHLRQDKWVATQKQTLELSHKLSVLNSDSKSLEAIITTLTGLQQEKQVSEKTHKNELEQQSSEREKLYGTKNPDKEEARLEKLVAESEKQYSSVRNDLDQIRQALNALKQRINGLQESSQVRASEIEESESHFIKHCVAMGINSEELFLSYRLTTEQRSLLSLKAKTLDGQYAEIQTRKKDREMRLSQELVKAVTDISIDELIKQQLDTQQLVKAIVQDMGAIEQKLLDQTQAKAKFQQQQKQCDAQRKECKKWMDLHALIGSVDGKKYRNFAQGLTFELMVSHANRQLNKMTDRYLLLRDEVQPLELNVVDNYQAGEIRSTKNLSGGESFIVSLSLALGLSKMASRNVRVDSLFLDEGFGTLDEDALEIALDTLSGLQQDGKLIGVISHVSALKERINTLIKVDTLSGGKSSINGPGCQQMTESN